MNYFFSMLYSNFPYKINFFSPKIFYATKAIREFALINLNKNIEKLKKTPLKTTFTSVLP